MKKFIISESLAQATINYLVRQPYVGVHQIISEFQNLVDYQQEKEEIKNKE